MKVLMYLMLLTMASDLFALPARSWSCLGQDSYYGTGVEFNIVFSDATDNQYTYQAIEFQDEKKTIVHVNKTPNCQPENPKDYQPSVYLRFYAETSGPVKVSKVELLGQCDAEVNFDIDALCKEND